MPDVDLTSADPSTSRNGSGPTGASGVPAVLVVGPEDWAVTQVVGRLRASGAEVHRCSESAETPFPCRLLAGDTCPLDRGVEVVVSVRVRPREEPSPAEIGVVCAVRAGVALVAAGVQGPMGLGGWGTPVPMDGDIAATCAGAAGERVA